METFKPSRTALGVALRRAAHQLYDARPLVFDDPLAVPILGGTYLPYLQESAASIHEPFSLGMRAFLVARSRYAEDQLTAAYARGVRQYVVLGAGLDTLAHRSPHPGLRVFEVDHPATQQWKRDLVVASNLHAPANLHYVPVDFESQNLATELKRHGLDVTAPTVFAWLGVVLYLTHSAFRSTLDLIQTFTAGSGVILDYALPRHALPPDELAARDLLSARVQSIGEPFQLFFTPEEIYAELSAFHSIEDLGASEINARYFANRSDRLTLTGRGGQLLSAWL